MSWHRPHTPARPADPETLLCTRQQAAFILNLHPDTIKRRYQPVACDIRTRAPLYDPADYDPHRHRRGPKTHPA